MTRSYPGNAASRQDAATADDFAALRDVEEAWLAAELGRAIANLAYPVGCGSPPHDYHLKAAAKALFDRYAKMIEMARHAGAGPGDLAQAWQDISTAPKDGSKVDLLYPHPRGRTIDCEWRQGGVDGDGRWIWLKPIWGSQPGLGIDWHLLPEADWEVCSYPNMEPTHWMPMPMPAPPKSAEPGAAVSSTEGK